MNILGLKKPDYSKNPIEVIMGMAAEINNE
jgi:hypothetical protein